MPKPPASAPVLLALAAVLALAGCGNKGALVRPPAQPLQHPGDAPPADELPPPSEPTEADTPDEIDPPPAADPPSDPTTASGDGDA